MGGIAGVDSPQVTISFSTMLEAKLTVEEIAWSFRNRSQTSPRRPLPVKTIWFAAAVTTPTP